MEKLGQITFGRGGGEAKKKYLVFLVVQSEMSTIVR